MNGGLQVQELELPAVNPGGRLKVYLLLYLTEDMEFVFNLRAEYRGN